MPLDSSERAPEIGPDAVPAEGREPEEIVEEPATVLGLAGSLAVHLALTLIGVAGIVVALRTGVGSLGSPGPGLWPLAAASLTAAAGAATVVQTVLGARVQDLRGSLKPAVGVALAVLFVLLFSFVGVVVALVTLFVLWTRLLGGLPWRAVVLWSVLAAATFYLVFGVVLATPFPAPLTLIP